MTKEWMKQFVDLVKSGAQLKAYKRYLGLDAIGVKAHLGKLAEYEEMLQQTVPTFSELKKKKKEAKDFAKSVEAEVVRLDFKKAVEEVIVTEAELIEKLTDMETDETDEVNEEDEDL